MSIFGLIAGILLYSPSKRYRFPAGASSVPFIGQERWHVVPGLVFGVVTCTWIFSGLLSKSPFAWLTDAERPNLDRTLRGDHVDLALFQPKDPALALAEATRTLTVKELELFLFGGEPFYLATTPDHDWIGGCTMAFTRSIWLALYAHRPAWDVVVLSLMLGQQHLQSRRSSSLGGDFAPNCSARFDGRRSCPNGF